MNTQEQLSEAYLLQAGLHYYRSLLQVQNSRIGSEIEQVASQLAQQETQQARNQLAQDLQNFQKSK